MRPDPDPATAIQPAGGPQWRLATYGSLSPGGSNHHQLDGLAGHWSSGHVRGRLVDSGWGADLGYPGLILDPAGGAVPVQVFASADLPEHWPRLDAFEGPGYLRTPVTVHTEHGPVQASIYVLTPAARAPR